MPINPLFAVHMLNDAGKTRAHAIAEAFSELCWALEGLGALEGREGALAKTHLEQAGFFAKKSMASNPKNQLEPGA